ncbi:PhoD-like phosphatase [Williamsia limnetica]|uniref:PhoD-like phosphatase n=1 Tax=Williamsia limnetica TaxID=882452 RepID=A0A318RLA1_WILLI|nr:PhoD-like phosphatase [Williamsia limnetica]
MRGGHARATVVAVSIESPALVLGPILRFVDTTRATVWVETDRECAVEVTASTGQSGMEQTWEVKGHHFAIVQLINLPSGALIDYSVTLSAAADVGEASVTVRSGGRLRTAAVDEPVTVAFGSCRRGDTYDDETLKAIGADGLAGLADRVAGQNPDQWPQLLLLLGDQVYADDPSPEIKVLLRDRRATQNDPELGDEVAEEICDFEEYTWLYRESWGVDEVSGLMASVPSCMILDDHDLRDDWNSSLDWRKTMEQKSWWRRRVIGAFSSYWIYQHLGNLSPDELAKDDLYGAIRGAANSAEREKMLADFAIRADSEPESARWSYVRDLGNTRIIMIDSRCSRDLNPDRRAMLDDVEWAWLSDRAKETSARHIVFGTSLPYLMLPALHHLEQWNEAVAQGAWGRRFAKVGEKLRLELDLEHWAAFGNSFRNMVGLVDELVDHTQPPASILWLSGDVHCSYVAEADLTDRGTERTALYQLTMSPFRNPLERPIRAVNRVAIRKPIVKFMRFLARRAGVGDVPITWQAKAGPWFDNGVMSLRLDGERASVQIDHASTGTDGAQRLTRTHEMELTP